VAGCCEYGDEPSGSGATELVYGKWQKYNNLNSVSVANDNT
jgi:hypothetical protein